MSQTEQTELKKKPAGRPGGDLLGTGKISSLILKFSVPSIIAMLVSSLYNIVDQYFIGQCVGTLGNAATNIAFPLAMVCTAIALLSGIGGASNFNLSMGRGEKEKAAYFVGNAEVMLLVLGVALMLITKLFLSPLLIAFGSPENVFPYAREYVGITAIGFPFLIFTIGNGHLIRGDGSPRFAMLCNLSGAIVNTVLDYLFVMVLGYGMAGAAWATVTGQIFSALLALNYMRNFKTVKLEKKHFVPSSKYIGLIASIGCASAFNQMAMMVVQVVLNNSLKYYGGLSVYGASTPIAVAGIVTKVFQVFFAVVIGLSQGSQPIVSFNYGAKNYGRVREAYLKTIFLGACVSLVSFILFQTVPRQILAIFGEGSEEYFAFGVKYFRIYMMMMLVNFMQPISSTFFTSIGKSIKGVFLSLTRQIIYLLPLILFLPKMYGIDGILYAGPIADFAAFLTVICFIVYEFKLMRKMEKKGR